MANSLEDRNRIIEENYGLVFFAAGYFKKRFPWVDYDDCCSAMNMAMMKAASFADESRKGSFRRYFMLVARNECVDLIRKKARERDGDELIETLRGSVYAGFDNSVIADVCLQKTVANIKNKKHRCMAADYFFNGYKYSELGKKYGMSASGVRKNLSKVIDAYRGMDDVL